MRKYLGGIVVDNNTTVNNDSYILVVISLQVIRTYQGFKGFRDNSLLNRPQVLRVIERVRKGLQVCRTIVFAGKNRNAELLREMFDLLMVGYRCQVFDKGNIWKTNDQVAKKVKD